MKSIVIIVFILIVASLARALYFLVRHQGRADSEKTMWSLVTRSGLSLLLFIALLLAVASKVVTPHRFGKMVSVSQNQQK